MAPTRQMYPSIPTSTSIPATSTPTSDLTNGSTITELFSEGSTPLIVAFVAIGLFFVSIVGMLVWRRVSRSGEVTRQPWEPIQPSPNPTRSTALKAIQRPVLWEVRPDFGRKEPHIGGTIWESLNPMTATVTFRARMAPVQPIKRTLLIKSLDPARYAYREPIRRVWGGLVSIFKHVRSIRVDPLAVAPPQAPPLPLSLPVAPVGMPNGMLGEVVRPGSGSSDVGEIEWVNVSSLKVSVIVAMPSRRRRGGSTAGRNVDRDQEQTALGEICIGTMEVPWRHGG